MKKKNCTCIIRHAITAAERSAASARLSEARALGDTIGITMTLAQLSGCPSSSSREDDRS